MSNGQPVRILSSPYRSIRKGERGKFVSIINYCEHPALLPAEPQCCNNQLEVWRIEFKDGRSSLFRPYEVEHMSKRK